MTAKGERIKAHFDDTAGSKSGFKGVCEDENGENRWNVYIKKSGAGKKFLGAFANKLEVSIEYLLCIAYMTSSFLVHGHMRL